MSVSSNLSMWDYRTLDRKLESWSGSTKFSNVGVTDEKASVCCIRSGFVAIQQALSKIDGWDKMRTLEIYCDMLSLPNVWELAATVDEVVVFARYIQFESADGAMIKCSPRTKISFYCNHSPADLSIQAGDGPKTTIELSQSSIGTMISFDRKGALSRSILNDPLASYFETRNVLDRLSGTAAAKSSTSETNEQLTNNLPALLKYQLLLAESLSEADPDTALNIAVYASNLSHGVVNGIDIFMRASTLTVAKALDNPGLIASQALRYDLSTCQVVLHARASVLLHLEQALEGFQGNFDSRQASGITDTALSATSEALLTVRSLLPKLKAAYQQAVEALDSANKEFNEYSQRMLKWSNDINAGNGFGDAAPIARAASDLLTILLNADTATPVNTEKTVTGEVKQTDQSKTTPEKGSTQEAAQMVVDSSSTLSRNTVQVYKAVKSTRDIVSALEGIQQRPNVRPSNLSSFSKPTVSRNEITSISELWTTFSTGAALVYQRLGDEFHRTRNFGGFFWVIAELGMRAQTLLAAQRACASAGHSYAEILYQDIRGTIHKTDYQQNTSLSSNDPSFVSTLKADTAEILLGLRLVITSEFKQYADAIAWHALSSERPVMLNPFKASTSILADASLLQAAVGQAAIQNRSQTQTFVFKFIENYTTGIVDCPANQMRPLSVIMYGSGLRESGRASFRIEPNVATFTGLSRVRVKSFSIELNAPKDEAEPLRRIYITVGSDMIDILPETTSDNLSLPDVKRSLFTKYDTVSERQVALRTPRLSYHITEKQNLYFQRTGTEIVLDGKWAAVNTIGATWSPFRKWDIEVVGLKSNRNIDELKLWLECEVTPF